MIPDEISPAEANERLGEFRPLDVREASEFHGPLGHLRGSSWIPLGELGDRLPELPVDRPLLVVCRSGRRSAAACRLLREAGREATNLAGGMIAWNRSGLPVERSDPRSLDGIRDQIAAWLAQVRGTEREEAVEFLRAALVRAGASFEEPERAGLEQALNRVEEALAGPEAPPDLDLALAAFRRWLAGA